MQTLFVLCCLNAYCNMLSILVASSVRKINTHLLVVNTGEMYPFTKLIVG